MTTQPMAGKRAKRGPSPTYAEPMKIRFRHAQVAWLKEEAQVRGVPEAEMIRLAVDELMGDVQRVEQLRPPVVQPQTPIEKAMLAVATPVKPGLDRNRVPEDSYRSGMTPPPTTWKDRTTNSSRMLRVGVSRCECPAVVPMDGVQCSACGRIR